MQRYLFLKYPFHNKEIYIMKGVIIALTALMVLSSGFAFAEEEVEMEAGIKMWYAGFKIENASGNFIFRLDPVLLVGPAFEAELPNHLFFEGEYVMSATDYEKTQGPAKLSADNRYLEVAVGYNFIPEVGIFAGYKEEHTTWQYTGIGMNASGSVDMGGPMLGVRGSYSFNKIFGVYASAAYMWTKSESKEPSGTVKEDAPGTDYQLGVSAKFSKAFIGSLGYRVESSKGDTSQERETFSGVTLDVMYAF
jgi:hypothetical protein